MAIALLMIVGLCLAGLIVRWWFTWPSVAPIVSSDEPVIASAVLTAAAHKSVPMAQAIEDAMRDAVLDCVARGVSMDDTATIQAAMLEARARVLGR